MHATCCQQNRGIGHSNNSVHVEWHQFDLSHPFALWTVQDVLEGRDGTQAGPSTPDGFLTRQHSYMHLVAGVRTAFTKQCSLLAVFYPIGSALLKTWAKVFLPPHT